MSISPPTIPLEREKKSELHTIEIQLRVSEKYGVPLKKLQGSHNKKYFWPRHIAMYLCTLLTSLSTPEIGRKFRGRDHTTVMHSRNKVKRRMKDDPAFAQEMEELEELLSYKDFLVGEAA